MSCEFCLSGRDNICVAPTHTCIAKHVGGYASAIRVNQKYFNFFYIKLFPQNNNFFILKKSFAIPIPDNLPAEYAAPLLCAGLFKKNSKPQKKL